MRKIAILVFGVIACSIITMCKKDSGVSIVNNWTLVDDSVYSNIGIAMYDSDYRGMNSDFFNFSANGKLYFKEGAKYDSCNYQLLANNKIIIDSISVTNNGEYVPGDITVLTPTKATIIITNSIQTPGGSYERIINLRR